MYSILENIKIMGYSQDYNRWGFYVAFLQKNPLEPLHQEKNISLELHNLPDWTLMLINLELF